MKARPVKMPPRCATCAMLPKVASMNWESGNAMPNPVISNSASNNVLARILIGNTKYTNMVKVLSGNNIANAATTPKMPAEAPTTGTSK